MKKIIVTILMLFAASQFSDIKGQKNLKMPQRTIKTNVLKQVPKTLPDIKTAEAFSDGNGVLLKWQTENETNLIGFNIYRSNSKENIRVNKNFILSSTTRNGKDVDFGGDYNYFDENGAFQNTYSIESIFSDGKRTVVNPVLPRYTSDLKNVSDLSSETYRQSTSSNNSIIEQSLIKPPTYLKAELENNQSLNDPVNQKWIAAQPGVKINITKEGFYRITRSELQAAGFNVSASTNFWQLYLNGEEQAIIVDPSDQYIEFYGSDFQDTYESGNQTYFLVVGPNPGRRMDTRVVRPVGGTIPATTFYQNQTTRQKLYYIPNIRNGDNQNFFGTFISETPAGVQFNIRGIDYSIRKTDISVVIQGASLTPHLTQVVVNGNDMGTVSGSNQESMTLEFTIPTAFLNEGANTVEFTVLDGSSDFSFFDSI
ncbi:MAG: hypothetical protein ABIP06_07205, partial [Pyrinomonadaceae bacterium]